MLEPRSHGDGAGVHPAGGADNRDPGYAATAVMLGESALRLAPPRTRSSAPAAPLLTPAVAMGDTLVERLRIAGMTLTVGPSTS